MEERQMNLNKHLHLSLDEIIGRANMLQKTMKTDGEISVIITGEKTGDIYILPITEDSKNIDEPIRVDSSYENEVGAEDVDLFKFELTNNKDSYILLGFKNDLNFKIVNKLFIPSEYRNKPVIEISPFAFYEKAIKQIDIPSSIQQIGDDAFSGCGIESIKLDEGIQQIANRAFLNNELKSLALPKTLTNVGTDAFMRNLLSKVTILGEPTLRGGAFSNNGIKQNSRNIINIPYRGKWELDKMNWVRES